MAEGGVSELVRQDWHRLLVALKTTSEGLLASHSSNVWNIYGGLNRICKDVERIMNHRLKVSQGPHGSCLDFWNFVRGLRWMNPTMALMIEQFHKMTRGGSTHSPSHSSMGRAWLRQSLLDHSLAGQLEVLTANTQHLQQHYEGDAYLLQANYLHAMLQCLHAVQQNKAALLADINPILLSRTNALSHPNKQTDMIRRRNAPDGHLVPMPVRMTRKSSVLAITDDQAVPHGLSIYREESATEALRNVLNKSESTWDDDDDEDIDIGIDSEMLNDPLMNAKIISMEISSFPKKSASFSGLSNYDNSYNNSVLVRGSRSQKSRSRTTDLLDRILNDEGEVLTKSIASEEREALNISDTPSDCDSVQEVPNSTCDSPMDKNVVQNKETVVPQSNVKSTDQKQLETTNANSSMKRYSHKRSSSDFGVQSQNKMFTKRSQRYGSLTSPDLLSTSLPVTEDNHGLVHRHKEGVFLQPAKGQSLRSFLSSQDFHTCAELDKENAHFTLAEGLISAIEQMKWNQIIRPQQTSDHHEDGDSDEEIQQLKQRIRIRRRECLKEKAENFPAFFDEKSDSMTTITTEIPVTSSGTPMSSSPCFSMSQGSSVSSEEVHDEDITEGSSEVQPTNLTSLSNSGLSLSMASLYSDMEIQKSNAKLEKNIERQHLLQENSSTIVPLSAESVAISLLRRFSEKQLPKASELIWLVSEQDAPQQLLPLPDSYPVSPDDSEHSDLGKVLARTRIRGNLEWAPPRPQIIFNIHPAPKRKVVLARQNHRCAGCGAKVEPGYTKRYRYCEYLGKYFCPCCHSNDLAYIPGRILQRWDFTKYYVSNFSRDLLKRIHKDPLFNILDINKALYQKVRPLDATADCRRQLRHLSVFLKTCRLVNKHQERLEKLPTHWINEGHLYSIAELAEIKKNEHMVKLKPIINECVGHIAQCPLCQAKGFICEVCRNMDDVIFPFELQKVKQCAACRSCYHKTCFTPNACPKCARIQSRKNRLKEELSNDEEEDEPENPDVAENTQVISR